MRKPSKSLIPDDFLTFADAGRLIGRSRQIIANAVEQGHLPWFTAGPYTFVRKADVLAYKKNPAKPGWKPGRPRKYTETKEKIIST